ncbi:MAG TPA: hypothetical protein P5105_04505 [Victivallales bacterium]|nr:hypothetical protein [Victivallales bacterium]HPO90327.1 hypothetical protein [Victivallales bacterium]HRR06523.1 hypothetical protein [Victivallales bacterium]HRR28904.1 hypothetical protein [Victivallales bacterium]
MFQKRGFIDHNLIKIKDKLAEAGGNKKVDIPSEKLEENESKSKHFPIKELQEEDVSTSSALPSEKLKNPSLKDEMKIALMRRKEEFRLLKRDICEKMTEKLSEFPEDIKITERRTEELKNAIERFASIIDELKAIDENNWDENTPHSEIGRACRKAENARLEYIRICGRLSTLQRESFAAENEQNSTSSSLLIHELSSISLKQGLKIGLFITLPVIITIIISALIISIAYIIALKL